MITINIKIRDNGQGRMDTSGAVLILPPSSQREESMAKALTGAIQAAIVQYSEDDPNVYETKINARQTEEFPR